LTIIGIYGIIESEKFVDIVCLEEISYEIYWNRKKSRWIRKGCSAYRM